MGNQVPIKKEFSLDRFVVDNEKVRKLLLENKVEGYPFGTPEEQIPDAPFKHETPSSLVEYLNKVSKEYNFELPEEPLFYLFHNLGSMDFDAGYLYTPYFDQYVVVHDPTLTSITKISKGMSKLFPLPVLTIYEKDKFAIPKLILYQEGKVSRKSGLAGNETYDSKYWKKEHEKWTENFDKILKLSKDPNLLE